MPTAAIFDRLGVTKNTLPDFFRHVCAELEGEKVMATAAHVHTLHELSERSRIDVEERDNRLAEARKERDDAREEAALLRRMLEGEFTGWHDFGGGEVRLYEAVRHCECGTRFVVEDDDSTEAPAWMTRDWLRAIEPKLEVKVTEGIVAGDREICFWCAWREGLL